MKSKPMVSIVVLNWNGIKIFPECIDALLKTEYNPIEILFVDNNSSDKSLEVVERYKNIKIVKLDDNYGYAGGNNRALPYVNGEYVCFLNNDVIVTPSWLNRVVRLLEQDVKIGVVGCRNMSYYEPEIIDGLYHHWTKYFSLARYGRENKFTPTNPFHNKTGYVFSTLGSSSTYRTSLFNQLGGFDETFFAYWEDVDLCMRVNNSGYKCVYEPDSVVYHMDQASFGKSSKKSFYFGERNKILFLKKNFPINFLMKYLIKIIVEDIRTLKFGLFDGWDLKTFLKARIDSLRKLHLYHFDRSKYVFNSHYISALINDEKINL